MTGLSPEINFSAGSSENAVEIMMASPELDVKDISLLRVHSVFRSVEFQPAVTMLALEEIAVEYIYAQPYIWNFSPC